MELIYDSPGSCYEQLPAKAWTCLQWTNTIVNVINLNISVNHK